MDVVVDSDVKPVDVYDDTDETDGRYGEVHAFKRRCGNGNHDRATICTDIIWRVRPDHEGADGAWRGLQEGKSGRAFKEASDSDLAALDSRCYTGGKGRTKLHPLVYERRDVVAYVCMLAMVIASVVLIVKF